MSTQSQSPSLALGQLAPALCFVLIASGCGPGDDVGSVDPAREDPANVDTSDCCEPSWRVEHSVDDGALLSVWGSGPHDVWVAGGQADRGLLLHSDGARWEVVDVAADHLLWWVYGVGKDEIYAVGDGGLILHFDGDAWARIPSGTSKQLFGVWGATEDDVWIVGGDPQGEIGDAVLLHGDASGFRQVELPQAFASRALFKVYGHGVGDVVMVGTDGVILRSDGTTWRRDPAPTDASLFSLWGRSRDDMYAVGGFGDGVVLHFDGASWTDVTAEAAVGELSGVFIGADDPVIAVGGQGYVMEMKADGTVHEPAVSGLRRSISLHSVWGDGEGTTYAVGGELLAYPSPMRGAIAVRR